MAGEAWDADEEEGEDGDKKEKAVPGEKKLTKRQLAKKKEEDERKLREAKEKIANLSEEDLAKLKEEEMKRIEKENIKLSSDLFGDMGDLSMDVPDTAGDQSGPANADNSDMTADLDQAVMDELKNDEPKGVQDYVLKSKDDFTKFATEVGAKVAGSVQANRRGDSAKLVDFLKIIISEATGPMSLEECNEVKKHFNTVYNNKAKDPDKKDKKKAGAKGPTPKTKSAGAEGSPYEDYSSQGAYGDDYGDFI